MEHLAAALFFYMLRFSDAQLLQRRHPQADAEHGDGLLQLRHRRQGGGDTDIAVVGVDAVGERSPCTGHGDARLLAQGQRPSGAAGHGVQTDEIAAHGPLVVRDAQRCDLPVQTVQHRVELGSQNGRVLLHQRQRVRPVLEEQHMPQLVDFVKTDGLDVDELREVVDVGLTGSHHRHARAGERYLAGGGELVHHVGVAVLGAQADDVGERHEIAVEFVDAVGVVPHQHEVRRGGLHGRQTANSLLRIHHALRVGVFGHVPHALHRRIADQLLHHVHVGAAGGHGHGDHLHAEAVRHLEVPVIAGHRADPLHPVQLAPGLLAVEQTVGERLGDGVVHQLQTGVAAHEHLLRLAAQNVREQPPRRGDARHLAVVPGLHAVGHELLRLRQQPENGRHQIQLLPARLAPGHIQRQVQRLGALVLRLQGRVCSLPLRQCHVCVFFLHDKGPPPYFFAIIHCLPSLGNHFFRMS